MGNGHMTANKKNPFLRHLFSLFCLLVNKVRLTTTTTLQHTKQDVPLMLSNDYGMVLVPLMRQKRAVKVTPNSTNTMNDKYESSTKYKRLSHSVHVQSDIRYR